MMDDKGFYAWLQEHEKELWELTTGQRIGEWEAQKIMRERYERETRGGNHETTIR